jgi:site-specific DNA-methyltransferase (adenine-specific)
MAVRIEDAGFEIRDMIAWVYGSGFPKSLNVSKAIDKAAGALQHEGKNFRADGGSGTASYRPTINPRAYTPPAPATDAARQWQGWGTALKPALEPITVARKPLIGTVANNVLEHGTGALNVDGCRVGDEPLTQHGRKGDAFGFATAEPAGRAWAGRWPANLIHDGGEEPAALLGDAARFFYCAKASCADRNDGCEGMPERMPHPPSGDGRAWDIAGSKSTPRANHHPTVKPTDLMRYLCRLVTPPNGTVLDPFMGSGSTGKAAALEGFDFIGIEREVEYLNIARARIEAAKQG